jgi:phage gpG-like protein
VTEVFWQGAKEFQRAMDEAIAKQAAAAREALILSAHEVERQAKAELSLGSHAKGEPTTSPPGEPPDLVSGKLRQSITVKGPTAVGANSWEAQVGPTMVYGRIQELGGDTGRDGATYLPPRPYMMPALNAAKDFMIAAFKKAWSWGG